MKNGRILLIEDDLDVLEIVTFLLREAGYEIIASVHCDVLHEIGRIKPDLILIDEWLEGESRGSDTCTALKADPATASIPVIIFSALSDIDVIARNARADGYIRKPFDIDDLMLTIKHFF